MEYLTELINWLRALHSDEGVRALILADGAEPGRPANLMMSPESWAEECVFELQSDAGSRHLRGLQIVRRWDDYVRATFEWVEAPG